MLVLTHYDYVRLLSKYRYNDTTNVYEIQSINADDFLLQHNKYFPVGLNVEYESVKVGNL